MKIFYADEDIDNIDFFEEALTQVDPSVCFVSFTTCDEILEFLKAEEKPDYLFLDVRMPEMGGIECLKFVRARWDSNSLPVMIFSNTKRMNENDAIENLGARIIQKPDSFEGLKKLLVSIITP